MLDAITEIYTISTLNLRDKTPLIRVYIHLFCIIVCCAIWPAPILAQQAAQTKAEKATFSALEPPPTSLHFQQFTVADGLVQATVYTIYQDGYGFVWFGTQSGLSRYDGYSFTNYQTIPFDSTSLQDGWITNISEGQNGKLWIGTTNGVSRFNPLTGKFRRYLHIPDDTTALTSDFVSDILVSRSGIVWISTGQGLTRLDVKTGKNSRYFHEPHNPASLTSNHLFSLYEDPSGILWIGSVNGLNRFNPHTGLVTRYLYTPGVTPTNKQEPTIPQFIGPSGVGMDIYVDPKNPCILWMTGMGIIRFDIRTGEHIRYLQDSLHPENFARNATLFIANDPRRQNILWVTSWKEGLLRFDIQTGTFTRYRYNSNVQKSLSDNDVFSIYSGHTGTVWIGTMIYGVNYFDPSAGGMAHYRHIPGDTNSLSANNIWSILVDHTGILWIGTPNSLDKINRITGNVIHYRHNPKDPSSISKSTVWSIYEDRSGTLWIATASGLDRLNRESGTFTHYRQVLQDSTGGVWNILEDHTGALWIGTNQGLYRMNPDKPGEFTRYIYGPNDTTSMTGSFVFRLYEDHSGTLWVGTIAIFGGGANGLNRLNRKLNTFTRYTYDPNDPKHSIGVGWILSIHERAREPGVLWLGQNGGLTRFDTRAGTFTHYTVEDGLPNNTVYGILEDAKGRLWLSTNRGLSRFNPETETFKNYGLESGLQALEFCSGAYFKTSDGEMFFGGINGVSAFYPEELRGNRIPPKVALTGFELFNEPVEPGPESPLSVPLMEAEEILLKHNQNNVTFEYVGLHYINPEENEYAYMLSGLEDEWVQAGTRRTVTYVNLDPGEYTFMVKAANPDEVWSQPMSLQLTITPPWWDTWWAYILYVIVVILFIFIIVKWRSRQLELEKKSLEKLVAERTYTIEHQAERLKELDESKSRFYANISHEFRTPLTLILGEIIELEKNKLSNTTRSIYQVMKRNGKRLLTLVNQLLDLSALEAGKMQLAAVKTNLITFLKPIAASYDSLAKSKNTSFSYRFSEKHIPIYIDLDKMEKVINNLLSNAFKFVGENGVITLKVSTEETKETRYAHISVKDNGPGITPEQQKHIFDRFYQADNTDTRQYEGSGIGLAVAKELTDLHHGTISLKSVAGKGAIFTVSLPLGKDHLSADEISKSSSRLDSHPEESVRDNTDSLSPTENGKVQKEQPAADENAPCILVVEDNADMRAFICGILTPEYRSLKASDGLEGWEMAIEEIPDLIISDVMMPKMDGLELCRKLKSDERTSHIPILLLTAKAGKISKIEGLETHADDYITKPFDADELLLILRNRIEQRARMRKRFSKEINLQPKDIAITSADERFLQKTADIVEEHMEEFDFDVETFVGEMQLSHRQVSRKLKSLTDLSPVQYIRILRLKRAAQKIEKQEDTISQIAYSVGFNNLSYFSKSFKNQFGKNPSEYETDQHQ